MKKILFNVSILLLAILVFPSCGQKSNVRPQWPAVTKETKPWTRWWWQGNALTREGITAELQAFQKAGLGGVEVTPIYGVFGHESRFVNYLSPEWTGLLMHTLREAERLGLGVDMATGTGWPFGGPWVTEQDACKNLQYKKYELKGGETLQEKIEFVQRPYLRAIGTHFDQIKNFPPGFVTVDARKLDIQSLREPIQDNKNLQALAIDQVQFEKKLKLQVLMAYSDTGETLNLTGKVTASGNLNWKPDRGSWKLYAVFEGWHGKMVERAGPGGEGNVIDHFSKEALKHYLTQFDSAFRKKDIQSLRAFFNDSYEVDDARGAADWTPALFEEFKARRGYDLRDHLPALFGEGDKDTCERILSDYRETISELLLTNFTTPWRDWAHQHNALVRNQAHGSPANILDLYATVDIPEIEGVEPLRIKMASSAGNITGKKLVSSESATWLNEHFQSNLADIKVALDRFMLNGVNHMFYHGTAYSPQDEPWPGWLFYAAVHFNPRNPFWKDFGTLNAYAARCQSFLQSSEPDNDVLLYYPIYDRFSARGAKTLEHFDGVEKQFDGTAFKEAAEFMQEQGYSFDYISDRQIRNSEVVEGKLKTEGGRSYRVLIIPQCKYIPMATLEKIKGLSEAGARIIFYKNFSAVPSGFATPKTSSGSFERLKNKILSDENILKGENLHALLTLTNCRHETMADAGIQFIRKQREGRTLYFIYNSNNSDFEGWLPLQSSSTSVIAYDPMDGTTGEAKVRNKEDNSTEVYVQLSPRQALILELYSDGIDTEPFPYFKKSGVPVALKGSWRLSFLNGGPVLPPSLVTDTLSSWTNYAGDAYKNFSGAAEYSITFTKPAGEQTHWLLDLGAVNESAEVYLNGTRLHTLIGPVYRLYIKDSALLTGKNELKVIVSNSMANRIIDLERRQVAWKKFYNVNFPSHDPGNRKNGLFDASSWKPRVSGILGPVTLTALGVLEPEK